MDEIIETAVGTEDGSDTYESEATIKEIDTGSDITEEKSEAGAVAKSDGDGEIDYERLLNEDMRELSETVAEGRAITVTDLKDPLRYGALRDLGLSPREAFLATGGLNGAEDNRAHLYSSVPRARSSPYKDIPRDHLELARELFDGMSDTDILTLYRKVTK